MTNEIQQLTKSEAELIASVYRLLPTELPNFVGRQQQKDMIQIIARTLARETHAVIEAPTGTGKSFGYQIPGIVLALSRDKRIIISTETANLQDQIAGRDLKVLSNILEKLGINVSCAVVKGRERYVCPLRLNERASQAELIDEDSSNDVVSRIADAWDSQWDGLRESLPFQVPQPIWMKVNNNRHICTNDRCTLSKECPYMDVKAQLKSARIIVTNHSYLLSVIAAQTGTETKKNPVVDFANNYYVFDEAHHLHDRCIETFSSNAAINEDLPEEGGRLLSILGSAQINVFKSRIKALHEIGIALRVNIKSMIGSANRHRFILGTVPGVLSELVLEYGATIDAIIDIFKEAIANKRDEAQRSSIVAVANNLSAIIGQLEEVSYALQNFAVDSSNPCARWIEVKNDSHVLFAAPFEASALARAMLWKNMRGVVLASATIASLGEFGPALAALGLPKDTVTAKLSSPLDYSRARILVPKFIVDSNSKGHATMVASLLRSTAFSGEHRGSLVYFTSRKKMQDVFDSFTEQERSLIIMQGVMSPASMITLHRQRIDSGKRSILFGLDSIAEGVDLPGAYCSLVIIDKLPFPSPDDPILASHSEHLENKGLHPFHLLMLPKAGLKLAQVVGRLIRTESDWGDVYVLDRRLVDKKYGVRLVKSTPFERVTQI
jgi:ATP-dependent DNA helicase DinG